MQDQLRLEPRGQVALRQEQVHVERRRRVTGVGDVPRDVGQHAIATDRHILDVRIFNIRILDIGVLDIGVFNIRVRDGDVLDIGIFDIRILDVGVFDIGILDIRVLDVGVVDLGVLDIGVLDVRVLDIGIFNVGVLDVRVEDHPVLEPARHDRAAHGANLGYGDVDLRPGIRGGRIDRPRRGRSRGYREVDHRARRRRARREWRLRELVERRAAARRLAHDRHAEGARLQRRVLREDDKAALHRGRQRLGVARRSHQQAAGDPRGVDVLVARARVAGDALLRAVLGVRRRGVASPVPVGRRPHVAVVGPDGVEDRQRRTRGGVERPLALARGDKRGARGHVDVVAHERPGALFKHRQVRRVVLQLLALTTSVAEAHLVLRHLHRGCEPGNVARGAHRCPDVDRVPNRQTLVGDPRPEHRVAKLLRCLRLAQVVVDQHQLAAGERERRHHLVAHEDVARHRPGHRRVVVHRLGRGERGAVGGGDHDDTRVAVEGAGAELRKAALRPREVYPAVPIHRHRRVGVGAELVPGRALIEFVRLLDLGAFVRLAEPLGLQSLLLSLREAARRARRVEFAAARGQLGEHDSVKRSGGGGAAGLREAAPRHVEVAVAGVHRDGRALVQGILGSAHLHRCLPGHAAIERPREEDIRAPVGSGAGEHGVAHVDRPGGNALHDRRFLRDDALRADVPFARRFDAAGPRVAASWDVDGHPGLVEEAAVGAGGGGDEARAEINGGVPVLAVVVVDEA